MSTRNNGAEFLAGLLTGAFFGGAAALLITPKTGSQVRQSFLKEAWKVLLRAADGQRLEEWASNEERQKVAKNLDDIRSAGL
jgi:gas vesicle protein